MLLLLYGIKHTKVCFFPSGATLLVYTDDASMTAFFLDGVHHPHWYGQHVFSMSKHFTLKISCDSIVRCPRSPPGIITFDDAGIMILDEIGNQPIASWRR